MDSGVNFEEKIFLFRIFHYRNIDSLKKRLIFNFIFLLIAKELMARKIISRGRECSHPLETFFSRKKIVSNITFQLHKLKNKKKQ